MIRRDFEGRRRRAGAAAVEAALVLPMVLLVLFGILEYGRLLALRQICNNAAKEGARFAVVRVVDAETTDLEVKSEVHRLLAGFEDQFTSFDPNDNIRIFLFDPDDPEDRSVSWKDAGFGEYIAVEIEGTFDSAVSGLHVPGVGEVGLLGSIPVRARSVMFSEAN